MDNLLKIGLAAKKIGMSVKALQIWDRQKILIPEYRSPTNRRFYTEKQLEDVMKKKEEVK